MRDTQKMAAPWQTFNGRWRRCVYDSKTDVIAVVREKRAWEVYYAFFEQRKNSLWVIAEGQSNSEQEARDEADKQLIMLGWKLLDDIWAFT